MGTDVHIRRRRVLGAKAAIRSGETRSSSARWAEPARPRTSHPLGGRPLDVGVHGMGADGGTLRSPNKSEPAADCFLRAALGRSGGLVTCCRSDIAAALPP